MVQDGKIKNGAAKAIDGLAQLDDCVCLQLRSAVRLVTQAYESDLDKIGLKITQMPVLRHAAAGPLTMTQLAQKLTMDRTTLTRNLQPLVRGGLVRVARGDDKRARMVALTERGAELLKRAIPVWGGVHRRTLRHLGRGRHGELKAVLAAVVAAAHETP